MTTCSFLKAKWMNWWAESRNVPACHVKELSQLPARTVPAGGNIKSFIILDIHIPMKTSDSLSVASRVPSLFQIAAFFEDFFPAGGFKRPVSPAKYLPVAEYMSNPQKLMNLLGSTKTESHAAI